MGYVSKNLLNNEQIIYNGKITNFIFLQGILSLVIAFSTFFMVINSGEHTDENYSTIVPFIFFLFLIYGLYQIVSRFIYKISTELVVTNKRVIAKTGFIKRNTIELNHNKVESISVDQSVLGRILRYGNVAIRGTGGVLTPIKDVDNPLAFRNETMKIVDK